MQGPNLMILDYLHAPTRAGLIKNDLFENDPFLNEKQYFKAKRSFFKTLETTHP